MKASTVTLLDRIAVPVVIFGLAGLAILHFKQPERRQVAGVSPADLSPEQFATLAATGQRIGPPDAPVVAVVFSDYGCSFSGQLHGELAELRLRYPRDFAIIVKQWIHPNQRDQAQVSLGAECAARQGAFEAYHYAALSNLRALLYWNGAQIIADSARVAGFQFEECLFGSAVANALDQYWEEGDRLGVRATPTVFVNGTRIVGAAPLEVLEVLISSAIAKAE